MRNTRNPACREKLAKDAAAWRGEPNMSQILEIELSDDVFLGLQKDAKNLAAEMRVAAAVKWYEMGRLTQAKAAELAGLSRAAFINELSRYGVTPLQETADEALQAVKDLGR